MIAIHELLMYIAVLLSNYNNDVIEQYLELLSVPFLQASQSSHIAQASEEATGNTSVFSKQPSHTARLLSLQSLAKLLSHWIYHAKELPCQFLDSMVQILQLYCQYFSFAQNEREKDAKRREGNEKQDDRGKKRKRTSGNEGVQMDLPNQQVLLVLAILGISAKGLSAL